MMKDSNRRTFVKAASAGLMGFGLAEMTALQSLGSPVGNSAQARQILVVYEEGGISQMDTWDPKPHAPVDHRTPYEPIATRVPGVRFSSLMPMISRQADKLAVVRSMTSAEAPSHPNACKEFFKGYRFNAPLDFPDIGSVVTHLKGTECPQLPGYVFCPGVNMPNHVSSTGFLPASRAPWKLGTKGLGEDVSDPAWKVAALTPQSGLNRGRMSDRRRLLGEVNHSTRAEIESAKPLQVIVHGLSRSVGAGCWWRLASTAVQSHWNTERFCRRQVSETVSMRSMKRLPDSLCVPNDSLR